MEKNTLYIVAGALVVGLVIWNSQQADKKAAEDRAKAAAQAQQNANSGVNGFMTNASSFLGGAGGLMGALGSAVDKVSALVGSSGGGTSAGSHLDDRSSATKVSV